ncbi:MAG: PHP domain-containing protein [Lachnospiraceae bacterium]|nr:PHP domain-containing protein [Lachnospiraceae bacterium]
MIYLISPDKKQYKANLHSHSTLSDGQKTPQELKEMYYSRGYQILSITDHEHVKNHSAMNEDDFLMLTGYEAHIRTNPVYDRYAQEVHLNLFAKDPENEKHVLFDRRYGKFYSEEELGKLEKTGPEVERVYSREYVNEFIRLAKEAGYLVTYNHPYWSMESAETILSYEGIFSLEMCNFGSWVLNHQEYNAQIYDKMLQAGKRVFCHSTDDNHNKYPTDHPKNDSFGGFTMIQADELTYEAVIGAMERGEMYASTGPVFQEISLEGSKLHIECSPVQSIYVYGGSKVPRYQIAEPGQTLTCAELEIDEKAPYIRISVFDKEGKSADTRGFFRDELGLTPLEG